MISNEEIQTQDKTLYIRKVKIRNLKKDLYRDRAVNSCPACNSQRYIKFGFFKGIQRYRCKDCNKTFSKATNSLCFYSKKDVKTWLKFIKLQTEKKSLRFCAKNLKISLVTAFYWRHKMLHALSLDSTPNTLKGVVHLGKAVVKENFKDKKKLNFDIEEISELSKPRENIWIIGARGKEDSMFVKSVFKSCWDNRIFNERVYSKIEEKSYIVAYGDRYLSLVAKRHNKKKEIQANIDDRIKFIRHNVNKWLYDYHGVATKYLNRYLSFFSLFYLDKPLNYINLIRDYLLFGNKFLKTDNIKILNNSIL